MRAIPVGYGNTQHRELIETEMQFQDSILVDIRFSQRAGLFAWSGGALAKKYESRYVWIPDLGNRNYKDYTLPIDIVDLHTGLTDLDETLQGVHTAFLLCGCANYGPIKDRPHGCHRRRVAEAFLQYKWSAYRQLVLPEEIARQQQEKVATLERLREKHLDLARTIALERLFPPQEQLDEMRKNKLVNYWMLSAEKQRETKLQWGVR